MSCPLRDGNKAAEHTLACELRTGAGTGHHHLSNGFSSADDSVFHSRNVGETVIVGKESGLDSGSKTRLTARPGELERHELLDASTL